jgi:hypothetical protein
MSKVLLLVNILHYLVRERKELEVEQINFYFRSMQLYSTTELIHAPLIISIVQGADWYWGPEVKKEAQQPAYIRKSALATAILAFILFISYLVLQVRK